jgi:hypothetical protein
VEEEEECCSSTTAGEKWHWLLVAGLSRSGSAAQRTETETKNPQSEQKSIPNVDQKTLPGRTMYYTFNVKDLSNMLYNRSC